MTMVSQSFKKILIIYKYLYLWSFKSEISDDEDDNNKESGSDESCDDEQDKDENNIEFDTEDGRATKEKNQEEKMVKLV